MTVEQIMERNFCTVKKNNTLLQTLDAMEECGLEGLPVVDDEGKVIGFITQGDIVRSLLLTYEELVQEEGLHIEGVERKASVALSLKRVEEAMSSPPLVVRVGTPLMRVLSLIAIKRVECLPVVDKEGKILGIVRRKNVLKALKGV